MGSADEARLSKASSSSDETISETTENVRPVDPNSSSDLQLQSQPISRVYTRDGIHGDPTAGHWGEGVDAPVDVDAALEEFQEIRRELSTQLSRVSTKQSGKSGAKRDPDIEEGDTPSNTSFVDLEEYLRNVHGGKGDNAKPKKIGVSFRNLSVYGFMGQGWMVIPTFPYELASFFGYDIFKFVQGFFAPKPQPKPIIQGFSGVVRPGEMLLVLGKPGSGASTFLRALTNQPRAFTIVEGDVNYSGLDFELAKGKYRGEILYNDEEDEHMPTLSVKQTVEFALKAKTPQTRVPGTSRKAFVKEMMNLFANMFKMEHVLNTIVGNAYVRGVSGGERKRVSIMEALASRSTINAWDNSTRGLDSSTAVDYIRSLRILTNIAQSTTIVTLYQAGEQIYREFDKVCLIYEGREIFYGKASEARAYFEELGFEASPRVTTSDFLTTITEPTTRHIKEGLEGQVPETPEALEAAFRASKYYTAIERELEQYDRELKESSNEDTKKFQEAVTEEKAKAVSKGSPYVVNFLMQVWYLTVRELQLQRQDKIALRTKLLNVIVLGVIDGSLFYKIQRTSEGAFFFGGALFFNLAIVAWMQLFEGISMVLARNIMAKQVAFAFYRPSALVLARTIADLPMVAVLSTIFTILLYWMADLVADAGKFFINLLFVFITVICITAFYRAIAAFSKDINVAIRYCFNGLNVLTIFAGYMQPYRTMKSWVYKWIFWADPFSYALESVMINQFHGLELECSPQHLIPGVPGASLENQACTIAGAQPNSTRVSGTEYIKSFGYEPDHLWRNFGILLLFTVGYIVIAMIGVEFMNFGAGGGSFKLLANAPKKQPEELPTTETAAEEASDEKAKETGLSRAETRKSLGIQRSASTVKTSGSIFTWRDVNYSVSAGGNEVKLLDDIHGFVKPGTLTALMGPSGAGKTTLLDNLGLRKRVGTTSGELLMDGKPLMPDFSRSTAFVEQQDVHDPMSTVREAMQFSAMLRQPPNVSKEDKYKFVEEIIQLLELEPLADALIGFPGMGLSVEERKRVTIGVELSSAPQELLFLDEPTSGLDANGALSIVRFLRKLADESNIAILCTIHQPSAVLIQEFDDLLLLKPGGKETYFGPIGTDGETVLKYFERNGAPKAARDANPAEYILDTIRTKPEGRGDWGEIWAESPEKVAVLEEIESIAVARRDVPSTRELRTLEYAMSLKTQIVEVTKRTWWHYWRDASYGFSKMYSNLAMAILGGVVFLQPGSSVMELQSRVFAVFLVLVLCPMILVAVQPKFIQLRTQYEVRERNSKIYSAPAWITAMVVVEIPYAILGTVFFFLPWYYMVGMPSASTNAGYAFLLLMLYNIWIPHIGMWIAAMCPDLTIINIINPFIFIICLGFNGILVTYDSLATFYRSWLYWVNPLTWLSRGILADVMHGVEVKCKPSELAVFTPPSGQTCGEYAGDWLKKATGYIVDMDATDSCQYCLYQSGDEFLTTINVKYSDRWRDLGIFIVFIFSNIFLVYVLYWAFREYRWSRLFARLRGKKD